MVRFNFSQMVWDFSWTNMVGFELSIYALHFQFGVVMLHIFIVAASESQPYSDNDIDCDGSTIAYKR